MSVRSAGIIAAGEGSRFREAGVRLPKPMIPIGGIPLIQHALLHFKEAGVRRVVLILNERERDCADWIRRTFLDFQLEIIVKSTQSSFESFWRVGRQLGPGRHLISTVDSICAPQELRKMAAAAPEGGPGVYLGVTEFVDDEKPLWVTLQGLENRITGLGQPRGTHATAGFYSVPGSIFEYEPAVPPMALRAFLKGLAEGGTPFYGVPLSKVVDVDSPKDVEVAERLLAETR